MIGLSIEYYIKLTAVMKCLLVDLFEITPNSFPEFF